MKMNQRSRFKLVVVIAFTLLLTSCGSGGSGGSNSTAFVEGTVRYNNLLQREATVELRGVNGAVLATTTNADGRFTFARVVPGSYQAFYIREDPAAIFTFPEYGNNTQKVTLDGPNLFHINCFAPPDPPLE